jgi:hypothetical protein
MGTNADEAVKLFAVEVAKSALGSACEGWSWTVSALPQSVAPLLDEPGARLGSSRVPRRGGRRVVRHEHDRLLDRDPGARGLGELELAEPADHAAHHRLVGDRARARARTA